MTRTITLKLSNTSENVEGIIRNVIRLYDDEIDSFRIIDTKTER